MSTEYETTWKLVPARPGETYGTWHKSIESAKDDVNRSRAGKSLFKSVSSCRLERDWHGDVAACTITFVQEARGDDLQILRTRLEAASRSRNITERPGIAAFLERDEK